jgi:hypothetical protein
MSNLIPLLIVAIYVVVPVAAAVWALFTLHRIRTTLERIERRLG